MAQPEFKTDNGKREKFIGVYLHCDGPGNSEDWSCFVNFNIYMNRQGKSPAIKRTNTIRTEFSKESTFSGVAKWLTWAEVTRFDEITLEINMLAMPPQGVTSIHSTEIYTIDPQTVCRCVDFPKILFIGAGHICQSILEGIFKASDITRRDPLGERILVTAPSNRNLGIIRELGCHTCLLEKAKTKVEVFKPDLVFLCIPTQAFLEEAYEPDSDLCSLLCLLNDRIKVSFMHGIALNQMDLSIQVIVNHGATVGATNIYYKIPRTYKNKPKEERVEFDKQLSDVLRVLKLIGERAVQIESEHLFDVLTGFAGSGIALFYEMIQAMTDAAVEEGLSRDDAITASAQMAKAAGDLILTKGDLPVMLKEKACPPAGIAIQGVKKWHSDSISLKVGLAVRASIAKTKTLVGDLIDRC